jgi:hypothetical protein
MISRRALVTGSAIGALSTTPVLADAATSQAGASETRRLQAQQEADTALLRRINDRLEDIGQTTTGLSSVFRSNNIGFGYIPRLRDAYTLYWKTNGKFPDFVEVGTDVFYDIYDYHVKQRLPLPVNRLNDGRMTITYMYTQLVVRVDQTPGFIGVPFDRQ